MRKGSALRRCMFVWLTLSTVVMAIALASGYRASQWAGGPQYLFTKYEIAIDVPASAATAEDLEIDTMYAEAGLPPYTRREWRPMWVLGVLDGALPVIAALGLLCYWWCVMSRRHGPPPAPRS